MTVGEIVESLRVLPGEAGWVVLSGGNPSLFLDDELVMALHQAGYKISMETQWIPKYTNAVIAIDHLVYSPKPPSSGMRSMYDREQWDIIAQVVVDRCIKRGKGSTSIKTVIFTRDDLGFAKMAEEEITVRVPMDDGWIPLVLSVGTPLQSDNIVTDIVASTLKILDMVKADPYFKNHRIVPQLHAMLWGRRRGV
jgi:7-carboxy-7-deazaguanine synthase